MLVSTLIATLIGFFAGAASGWKIHGDIATDEYEKETARLEARKRVLIGIATEKTLLAMRRQERIEAAAENLWILWGERDEALENIDRLVRMVTEYGIEKNRYKNVIASVESVLDRLDNMKCHGRNFPVQVSNATWTEDSP